MKVIDKDYDCSQSDRALGLWINEIEGEIIVEISLLGVPNADTTVCLPPEHARELARTILEYV